MWRPISSPGPATCWSRKTASSPSAPGGNYALSAARALYEYEEDPEVIARKAMAIAARICVYTNENLTVEVLGSA